MEAVLGREHAQKPAELLRVDLRQLSQLVDVQPVRLPDEVVGDLPVDHDLQRHRLFELHAKKTD